MGRQVDEREAAEAVSHPAHAYFAALSRVHRITVADGRGAEDVCRALLSEGVSALGARAGGIFMVDEAAANLELTVAVNYPEPLADRYRIIPLSEKLPLVDTIHTGVPSFLAGVDDYAALYPDFTKAHPELAKTGFAAVPLVVDGRRIGAVLLGFSTPVDFTPEVRTFLVALADGCASALERARRLDVDQNLRQVAEGAIQRVDRLHEFTSALAQAITLADVNQAAVDSGMAATSAQSAALWLKPADGESAVLTRHEGELDLPESIVRVASEGPARTPVLDAIRGGKPVWIESRRQLEERYPQVLAALAHTGEASLACLPLLVQGRSIGALLYAFEGVHRFHEAERASLQLMAWYSAQAIERARLYVAEKAAREAAEANQRRSDFLADVGMLLAASLDFSNILHELARATVPRFVDWCVFELVDQRLRAVTPLVANHVDPLKVPLVLEARQRIRDLGSIEGLVAVMRTGTSILHPVVTREFVDAHVGADPILAQQMAEIGVASSLTVPIAARGEVLGAILLTRVDPARAFDERDVAMAEELGRMVGLTVDNARLYQEAREADRQKDEFLAMLSHELRNPLAPIVSALEVMNFHRETNFADEREIIARNVRHIVRLVDDLLDVSRITQGKIQLEPERCEVASIIEAAVEMAKPLVTQRTQRLSVSLAGHRLPVNADQARLTQAIANLLNNASQYTEHGGAITISAHAHGNDAVIRVEDSGVGIAAELLPRIFDVFVQGSTALDRSQGGLGIGLTVVKHLVNLHGGSVSAHSAGLGKGSEFVVRLPLMDRRTV